MPTFERIPKTRFQSEFPVGDIKSDGLVRAHELLYEIITCENPDERYDMLEVFRYEELSDWYLANPQPSNHGAVMDLSIAWGHRKIPNDPAHGAQQFYVGFGSTVALIHYAQLLPTDFNDYTAQINEMELYSPRDIESFARESMHQLRTTHFNLHSVIAPLSALIADTYSSPEDDEGRVLLDAGAGLAYVMATTTQMENNFADELKNEALRKHIAGFALGMGSDE